MPSIEPTWHAVVEKEAARFARRVEASGVKVPVATTDALNVIKVPLEAGVLLPDELEITGSSIEGLLAKLSRGEWSAEQVTRAFCRRALLAHQLTNCLTNVFFERAVERAKLLDAEFARTGKPTGPLHGLPISLKNQVDVEGEQMDLCYVGWVGRVAKKNAVVVDCLLKQGAVLYCHTNMPQALMSGETVCNLHGRTVNPHNRALSAGGSSGGEGALIAMRGSILGVGSDIGGSVRIPCAFNGLYGLRPSYNRMPYGGSSNSMEGFEAVHSVLGPMTVSVDGLKVFFKAVLDAEPWRYDPVALHMPWSEPAYELAEHGGGKALCFGFNWHNGLAKPDPPFLRAMEKLKEALLAPGHIVVDYSPPDAATGATLLTSLFVADGGEDIKRECALSGEPVLGGVLVGMAPPPHLATYDYWQLCLERRKWVKGQLDAWEATKDMTGTGRPIDAVVAPPAPYPSFRHGDRQDIFYTGLCNICDYPSAVFPVTAVDPALDVKGEPHAFASAFDKLNYERYDPEVYRDAPVALQVYARKGEDEATIRFAEICAAALEASR
ncbi:general amidase [Rhodotorula diobovata]|uniref:amidase n=1 Tax=Rhodotorula diobovata TaxID=5288 RepID=A0A5C5FMU9_9BASI|nr:general amidase [Rhodotorula diobovata]